MKSISMLVLVLFASSIASSNVFGNEADMKAFFKSAEGIWRGNGQVESQKQDGTMGHANYLIDFGFREHHDSQWGVRSRVVYENGYTIRPWINFIVSGDMLTIISDHLNEPVKVTVSVPDMLAYTFRHADQATGRVYDLTFQYAICGDGTFKGEGKTLLNDVVVLHDHFESKKEQHHHDSILGDEPAQQASAEAIAFCARE